MNYTQTGTNTQYNYELSMILPARSEMFLKNTVEDILNNKEARTEVIVVLDGEWADPPIIKHPDVNVIYVNKAIGQRAATNLGVRLSKAKYVAKCDAHCSFDKGFDRKMIEGFKVTGDNVTMAMVMRNLHAFDWVCGDCDWVKYQGPTPLKCEKCGSTKIIRKMVWEPKPHVHNSSYCFDSEPHFQYYKEYEHNPKYIEDKKTGFTESMAMQGSFFMATRENYWKLELSDEKLGNWGNQGVELACKTWLSGGRVLCNHNTWYAHMFRTQGGDFGFPWPNSGRETQKTKNNVRDLFWENKWPKQIHPLSWLVEKFWPVPGWTEEALVKLEHSKLGLK